jgi:hypothetical protein
VALAAGTAGCATTGKLSPTAADTSAFIVSRAVFEQAFPDRNPFYSYDGLIAALRTYPAFTTTGDDATRRREAAAFLANVDHDTPEGHRRALYRPMENDPRMSTRPRVNPTANPSCRTIPRPVGRSIASTAVCIAGSLAVHLAT